ncbi:MAG: 1,4-alpha-glucan branching protein domain-containing protein, partial [Spirochaetota bacterium]
THSFLPLFQEYPETIEAQIQTAIISHGRTFGCEPKGMWIPECGYFPGLEKYLKANSINYFFTAAHALLFADSKPKYGVYAPVYCPNGIAVFGRDLASSHAVWSSEEGYPGDFLYRDFYRDIGFDLPLEYIGPYVHDGGLRINTGYKYYAITGSMDQKMPYNPQTAKRRVEEHAENFVYNRIKQLGKLGELMDRPPLIVSPYDAELFGHWWFEGTLWIEMLIRKLNQVSDKIQMVTPTSYLSKYSENQVLTPSFSSWGNKGYADVWLNGSNDWVYRHIHKAIDRMKELVKRFPNEKGLKERVLNQAAREVLLSQASDWPFIMKTGTTVPYAVSRVKEHIYNFTQIYENLCKNTVDTEWLTTIEKKNNIFPDIDYRIFGGN